MSRRIAAALRWLADRFDKPEPGPFESWSGQPFPDQEVPEMEATLELVSDLRYNIAPDHVFDVGDFRRIPGGNYL